MRLNPTHCDTSNCVWKSWSFTFVDIYNIRNSYSDSRPAAFWPNKLHPAFPTSNPKFWKSNQSKFIRNPIYVDWVLARSSNIQWLSCSYWFSNLLVVIVVCSLFSLHQGDTRNYHHCRELWHLSNTLAWKGNTVSILDWRIFMFVTDWSHDSTPKALLH
jgi:hypothetical protein